MSSIFTFSNIFVCTFISALKVSACISYSCHYESYESLSTKKNNTSSFNLQGLTLYFFEMVQYKKVISYKIVSCFHAKIMNKLNALSLTIIYNLVLSGEVQWGVKANKYRNKLNKKF